MLSSMIALPAATALQLKVGFKRTLIAAIVISIIDAFLGLFFAYLLDAAPGGVTALASVAVLLLVLICRAAIRRFRHDCAAAAAVKKSTEIV